MPPEPALKPPLPAAPAILGLPEPLAFPVPAALPVVPAVPVGFTPALPPAPEVPGDEQATSTARHEEAVAAMKLRLESGKVMRGALFA